MRKLIYTNMLWNAAFFIMALSELLGLSGVHETLPWWCKWIWGIGLIVGNLSIHLLMLREDRRVAWQFYRSN